MDHFAIANQLREIGALLELEGAQAFRVQAYVRGARAVESVQELGRLVRERRLTDLPGIGTGLAAVISELHTTGHCEVLDRLRASLPPGALTLAPVATLEQIRRLHAALGVTTLEALEAACLAGRVRGVHGFGEKTEARLLERIVAHRTRRPALTLGAALALAETIAEVLRAADPDAAIEVVGAARRGEETVEAVELLVTTDTSAAVFEALGRFAEGRGGHVEDAADLTRRSARLADGVCVVAHATVAARAAWDLVVTTGPIEHVAALAARLGRADGGDTQVRIAPGGADGPCRIAPGGADGPCRIAPGGDEPALYRAAGLHWVPPELRDDPDALATAADHDFRLLAPADIRGMVHCHTNYSDGQNSIAEMVRAAEALGMAYLTITDHSPTASYAGGVDADRLRRQWDEIARVQETTQVRILRGTESDILEDGALDYPDALLEQLDIVIASIHNRYQQDAEATTKRLVHALSGPVRTVWGHGLGRLLLRRAPVLEEEAQVARVLDAVAKSGGLIELNGDPNRMDLAPRWARLAHARGIRFVASVDAHRASEMRNLSLAVTMARRAGLGPADVVNTLGAQDFLAAVRPTR